MLLGGTATQEVIVGNNFSGLSAGTGANDVFAYSITGSGYTTATGSTGNTINASNTEVVNVAIDTSSVGAKGGSVTVTPTAAANNFSVNGTAGDSPAVLSTSTVNVVEKRVVSSSSTVDLGTAFVGGAVSGEAGFATSGDDSTKTRVTLANATISPNADGIGMNAGGTGGFFDDAADAASRTLSGAFVTAGQKSGTVNVAVTGEGLDGEGAYNDVEVAYTGTALAHSNGSFSNLSDINSTSVDTGNIDFSSSFTGTLTVYNLSGDAFGGDYTGDLNFKDVFLVDGDGNGTLQVDTISPIGGGDSVTFAYEYFPNVEGAFSSTYRFVVGDNEMIAGWLNNLGGLEFTISGNALDPAAVPEPLTAAGVLLLSARVLGRRSRLSI